jgi:hypothetical protein
MATKYTIIFRDVLYAIIIALLLLPSNPTDMSALVKVILIVLAIAQRVWQHVTYYKQTGKIY